VLDADAGPRDAVGPLLTCATHVAFSAAGLAQFSGDSHVERALVSVSVSLRAMVGVTLGAQGFLWREEGKTLHAPGIAVDAVDTHAAGDVWHGAYTVALAEHMPIALAARFANHAAALKCARHGGRDGAPTRAEVIQRMQQEAR
jgi:sulfofructose kinase